MAQSGQPSGTILNIRIGLGEATSSTNILQLLLLFFSGRLYNMIQHDNLFIFTVQILSPLKQDDVKTMIRQLESSLLDNMKNLVPDEIHMLIYDMKVVLRKIEPKHKYIKPSADLPNYPAMVQYPALYDALVNLSQNDHTAFADNKLPEGTNNQRIHEMNKKVTPVTCGQYTILSRALDFVKKTNVTCLSDYQSAPDYENLTFDIVHQTIRAKSSTPHTAEQLEFLQSIIDTVNN